MQLSYRTMARLTRRRCPLCLRRLRYYMARTRPAAAGTWQGPTPGCAPWPLPSPSLPWAMLRGHTRARAAGASTGPRHGIRGTHPPCPGRGGTRCQFLRRHAVLHEDRGLASCAVRAALTGRPSSLALDSTTTYGGCRRKQTSEIEHARNESAATEKKKVQSLHIHTTQWNCGGHLGYLDFIYEPELVHKIPRSLLE